MKIRKKVIGILLTAALIISASMSALANPVDDMTAALVNAGIPTNKTSDVIEYLQKTTITSAQSAAAISDINQIKALVGSQTDLSKLDTPTKAKIQAYIKDAASTIGLTATFSMDSTGKTVLAISDSSGVLLNLSGSNAIGFMNNFSSLIAAAQAFSVNPAKTDPTTGGTTGNTTTGSTTANTAKSNFTAVNGSTMKHTGTKYGTMMVAGILFVAAAALSFGFKKKTDIV